MILSPWKTPWIVPVIMRRVGWKRLKQWTRSSQRQQISWGWTSSCLLCPMLLLFLLSRDRIEFQDLYLFISIFKGFLSASSCPHQQYQLPFVCSSVFGVFVSSFLHSVRNGWEVNPVFLFPSFPLHQSIRLPELQSRLKPKKSPAKKKFIRLETKMEDNEDS